MEAAVVFMWNGAIRSGRLADKAAVVLLGLSIVSFVLPCASSKLDAHARAVIEPLFGPLEALIHATGFPLGGQQIFGMLSFVYLYHYLNWFSKVKVIRWHHIGGHRAGILVALYIFVLSCYAVSFPLGIVVSLVLSHAHVMLELPLNVASIRVLLRPTDASD
jgi:hypothetical protein